MKSRCRPFPAPFPKILKAPTELGTTQGDDGVCALHGPAHACAFESGANDHFAAGLEHAGGGTQALRTKFGVAHAGAIADDVPQTFRRFVASVSREAEVVDNVAPSTLVQFRATLLRP